MKHVFISAAILFGTLGCANPFGHEGGQKLRIPWPDGGGRYSLQTVAVDSFLYPEKLQGSAVEVLVNPSVDGSDEIKTETAVGRFTRMHDDTLVPSDFVSMQGAVVSAHMERLQKLDEKLGIGSLLPWPRRIAIQAEVTANDPSGGGSSKVLRNNAIYESRRDLLFIVPYTDQDLPISLNGGVIAHEHFHSLFQRLVLNKLSLDQRQTDANSKTRAIDDADLALSDTWEDSTSTADRNLKGGSFAVLSPGVKKASASEFNQFLLRAVNEGFADFWAWVYTGDPAFVGRSVQRAASQRSLSDGFDRLPTADEILGVTASNFASRCNGILLPTTVSRQAPTALAYCLGTQYARFMVKLTQSMYGDKPSLEQRQRVASTLIKSLEKSAGSVSLTLLRESESYLSPSLWIRSLQSLMTDSLKASNQTCDLFKAFLPISDDIQTQSNCLSATKLVPASLPNSKSLLRSLNTKGIQ